MCMKGIGRMIKLMEVVTITTLMVLNMLVNGSKTNNMVKVAKLGLTVLNIQALIIWVKNMVMENFCGLMDQHMRENFKIIM